MNRTELTAVKPGCTEDNLTRFDMRIVGNIWIEVEKQNSFTVYHPVQRFLYCVAASLGSASTYLRK